jgi:hypothetical protein
MTFTVTMIEDLLSTEAYAFIPRMNKNSLSAEELKEVKQMEAITSFGQEAISLFDNLCYQKQGLPSHKEYTEAGLIIYMDWLKANRPELILSDVQKTAISDRVARTYTSKVVELHLDCLLKEELPHLKVKTFSMLDSVMGVDFVVEDDKKRYYVHVTTNSPYAESMLKQKENRGGTMVGSTYVKYSRDFTGDLMLRYDREATESTKIVNGFPLFDAEYIAWRFKMAKRQSDIGELLTTKYSKLQHFKDWAKTYLRMNITSI